MAKSPNDDYFNETTMSFGQHLEELRVALFRSLVALIIFFIIGLFVAKYAIAFMKGPLEQALEDYYLDTNIERLTQKFGNEEGELDPTIQQFMRDNRVVSEEIFVEQSMLELWSQRGRNRYEVPKKPDEEGDDSEKTKSEGEKKSDDTNKSDADKTKGSDKAKKDNATKKDDGDKETDTDSATPKLALPKVSTVDKQEMPAPDQRLWKFRIWRTVKSKIKALNAQEAFMIWLKGAFIVGAIMASPFIFWFIWEFVAAGLYPHEKRFVYIFLPFSLLLFLAGASLAFFAVFKPVLAFLFSFNRAMGIEPDPRISEWIGFVLFLPLGFGVAFQLPLVMLFLNRIGVFTVSIYLAKWRIAILVIFLISMILTPADPISMLLMALPLTVLYFLGVGLCHWMPRSRNPFQEEVYEP